ncbi:Monofunctional C1-tetrahydrofolate synthase, mitochondrial [Sparganum proliferum]
MKPSTWPILCWMTPLQVCRLHNGDFMKKLKETTGGGNGDDPTSRVPTYLPCAPAACLHLLQQVGLDLDANLRCLVIGYGHLVGGPLTSLLLHATKLTLTVCREFTSCLQEEVARADVLIAGAGVPGLVRGEWIRPGAIVLDCGVNIPPSGSPDKTEHLKLVGDVDFETAVTRAGWITPVPGGVGPVTVAMLLNNTFRSALHFNRIDRPPVLSLF